MAAPILTLTEAATDRAKLLIRQSDKPVAGIRVGVKTRGCSGYSYFVEYAEEALPFEECVEANGIKVYIDPMATMFILGSEMDYQENKLINFFQCDIRDLNSIILELPDNGVSFELLSEWFFQR